MFSYTFSYAAPWPHFRQEHLNQAGVIPYLLASVEADDVSKGDEALCSTLGHYPVSLSWKASTKAVQVCKASG